MTVDVVTQITIDRAVQLVAAYAGDPSNAPTWYRRIASAEWQTPPPMQLGSQVTFRARFMGKDLVYTYEITEFTPGASMTMQTSQGPFPMSTVYTWGADGPSRTTMTLRNHGEPRGFSKMTAPLMSFAMKRAMAQDLRQLKQLLERSDAGS